VPKHSLVIIAAFKLYRNTSCNPQPYLSPQNIIALPLSTNNFHDIVPQYGQSVTTISFSCVNSHHKQNYIKTLFIIKVLNFYIPE